MNKVIKDNYRKDIDGLRAIAVLAVILFHLGYLPNGYLGVDIFFAISGYLITKIVYNEAIEYRFSIINFYLRRIRRIIPLVLFTTMISLIIGAFVMLPDDFENLSQSVLATNFFSNNILLLITTGNYWDIVNDYKPLMHTWSLGVEEQFYLFYPIIFLLFNGKRSRYILAVICTLAIISLLLFTFSSNEASKFYSIQFRFFEMALGGMAAIFFRDKAVNAKFAILPTILVLAILIFDFHIPSDLRLIIVVVASIGLLVIENNRNKLIEILLENKIMVGIGKISFSLYMWHQIVLAYTRYFIIEHIGIKESIILFTIIILLSIFSYFAIEQPFRDKKRINTKMLLTVTGIFFIIITSSSFYLYYIGGIIRDVPELEIYKAGNNMNTGSKERNIHIAYNAKIYDLDKNFTENDKIKVLIIGNSFARDFANVLLESKFKSTIEISYVYDIKNRNDINERIKKSRIVFFSDLDLNQFTDIKQKINIDTTKVWVVGTKNFGTNNGIFYNKRKERNYYDLRTAISSKFIIRNDLLKTQWGAKYIDLIGVLIDNEGKVPVFTPDRKFISQDCTHLTEAGAKYVAQILKLEHLFIEE